ncbi:MAG: hypothetical protein SFZ23_03750 [Planctomycetota bacterium]|nr:hypothetical protein [Planctomycetota bacterium]
MATQGASSFSPATDTAKCVVWHSPEEPLLSEWRLAMEQEGWQLTLESSAHLAFARLCRLHRDLQASDRLAFVMASPANLAGVHAIMQAIERYAPRAAMYRLDGTRLQGLGKDESHAAHSAPTSEPFPLPLENGASEYDSSSDNQLVGSGHLLTNDELAMLLSPSSMVGGPGAGTDVAPESTGDKGAPRRAS